MKKNRINAFTLVEMLIVIVIIGILIAALMPRMQAAQGRARDVSRKTALSQLQSAIVTSQGDKGVWPGQKDKGATGGIAVSLLSGELRAAGMNSVPMDPLKSSFKGLGGKDNQISSGDYGYMVTKRNGSSNGGFILMAKTEVEGGSNWVVCENSSSDPGLGEGVIKGDNQVDITEIVPCTTLNKTGTTNGCKVDTGNQTCYYTKDSELRYIVLY